MGLLDEAIRQHLELKRQHGASDEEVKMQEQEALGPVRREPAEPPAEAAEPEEPAPEYAADADLEPAPATDLEPAAAEDLEPAAEADLEPAPAADLEPAAAEDLEHAPEANLPQAYVAPEAAGGGDPAVEEEALPEEIAGEAELDELAAEELEDPIDAYDAPGAASVEPPTEALPAEEGFDPLTPGEDTPSRGFEALREPAPAPAEGDEDEEDVLEETPEFLQETPEHDRLWFEQKPPRDFDFDE